MNGAFLTKWSHSPALSRERRKAFRDEIQVVHIAIGVTLLSILGFAAEGGAGLLELSRRGGWAEAGEFLLGKGLISFLLFSVLSYQLTRLGYLKRCLRHQPAPASELDRVSCGDSPKVTVLVPCYKEEPHVVRQALLSAALQPVPNRRVVLLIDDPPAPGNREDAARLAAMRRLPHDLHSLLAGLSCPFEQALAGFTQRKMDRALDPGQEVRRLAALLGKAADMLDRLADDTTVNDHNDALFVERILRTPAHSHRARACALLAEPDPAKMCLLSEYRRLAALFQGEIASFERKRYANLSHEPNKAMNLNSYIALLGKSFRETGAPDARVLEPADDARTTLRIPDADFLIVLDADSVILPDYSLRLLHFMTRPGSERVAVAQTPYASVPGARSLLEQIAGATTDVQLMTHQGSTLFGAGSWVGASALVRRIALEDIAVTVQERGYPVRLYVRDRTLNEDTDTTVELIRKGWTVYNYPDRLAYSATPPDFGSLLIQRRRWATGGLIILPNLLRYFLDRPSWPRLWEVLLRAQYILSAPLGSLSIFALLVYPFHGVWSAWALAAFLAWLFTFQRDLMHNGNPASSLFRAAALNGMLLPINLSGAIHSIEQLCTGRKFPFQRTPKVRGRTTAPPAHILTQIGLLLFTGLEVPAQYTAGNWMGCLFYASYAAAFGYALQAFIGWDIAAEDLFGRRAPHLARAPARYATRFTATAVCLGVLPLGYLVWATTWDLTSREVPLRAAAVTFDDLPVISVTPLDAEARRDITRKLLTHITSHNVPATGFVNEYGLYGFVREDRGAPDPDGVSLLQLWLDAELDLGNHTFAHTDLHAVPPAAFKEDVVRGETVTRELLRRKDLRLQYFRHPYLHTGRDLETRQDVERFLAERGYRVAPVTVDNEDWLFAAAYSKAAEREDEEMMHRVGAAYLRYTERAFQYSERLSAELFGREIKQVLLLHANALNADYFDELAQMMKRRGYSFITLEAALRAEAYTSADIYTGEESLNWLARWAVTRGIRTTDNVLDDFPDVPEFVQEVAGIRD